MHFDFTPTCHFVKDVSAATEPNTSQEIILHLIQMNDLSLRTILTSVFPAEIVLRLSECATMQIQPCMVCAYKICLPVFPQI